MERIYSQKNESEAIRVKNNFYSLVNIGDDDEFEFDFEYFINQSYAVVNNLTAVKIKILYSQQKETNIISNPYQTKNKDLVDNIVNYSLRNKIEKRENFKNVASAKISDFTSKINNSSISSLRAKISVDEIPGLRKNKITVTDVPSAGSVNKFSQNVSLNLGGFSVSNSLSKNESQTLVRKGIDPSNISLKTTNSFVSSRESFLGLSRDNSEKNKSYDNLNSSIIDFVLKDSIVDLNSGFFEKYENLSLDEIQVKTKMKFHIPQSVKNIFIEFHLLEKCGSSRQIERKQINVDKLKREFYTPIVPPSVALTRNSFSSTLQLIQRDKVANSILLYKKIHDITSEDPFFQPYSFIGEYKASYNDLIKISVESAYDNPVIYRAIPAYNEIKGSVFSNVISSSKKYRHTKYVKLVTKLSSDGILLEARNIPYDAVSFLFLYRNLNQKSFIYNEIDGPVLVSDQNRISNYVSKFVTFLKDNEIYEFSVKCFYRDGTSEILDKEIFEYSKLPKRFVSIETENLSIDYKEEDVSFDVLMDVKEENIDTLIKVLENQGLKDLFTNEIRNEKDFIKNLLVYKVERINLQTGEKENLGIQNDINFSDKKSSFKTGSKKIRIGNSYRYIVSVLARDPSTLFENNVKIETDVTTKKSYSVSPYRSRNPLTLFRGTIYTQKGLKVLQPKNDFELGETGSSLSFDVIYSIPRLEILDAKIQNISKNKNLISWKLDGENDLIDHFLIVLNKTNENYILGACHNNFDDINFQWTHNLDENTVGSFYYSIIPVFNDYSLGTKIKTNLITIIP
jgi:hypothetical protein